MQGSGRVSQGQSLGDDFVSLEFREEYQAREIHLAVVNTEVEFEAMELEEGRQNTG